MPSVGPGFGTAAVLLVADVAPSRSTAFFFLPAPGV